MTNQSSIGRKADSDSGFVHAMAPDMARRQLTVSAALVALLGAATIFVAASGQFKPRYVEPANVKLTIQAPGSLQIQHAGQRSNPRGG